MKHMDTVYKLLTTDEGQMLNLWSGLTEYPANEARMIHILKYCSADPGVAV